MQFIMFFVLIFPEFNTECPTECSTIPGAGLALKGTSADYGINTPSNMRQTFPAGISSVPISITVPDDNEEELKKYFCLSITDPSARGNQWFARIVIPWNDRKKYIHILLSHDS